MLKIRTLSQMVGLFRKNQYATLGFTCNPDFILPRVLIQDVAGEGVSESDTLYFTYIKLVN